MACVQKENGSRDRTCVDCLEETFHLCRRDEILSPVAERAESDR